MLADRASILRGGTEVTLQTRPVDPRDFLRGDYVALSYAISSIPAGVLENQRSPGRTPEIFVKLAPNADGYYEVVSAHLAPVPVAGAERLIRGRIQFGATCGGEMHVFCRMLTVKYGIESYFVPQTQAQEIEGARNQHKVAIVAAVTPSGRAAIKRLLLDGQPVYEEPLF
jgi:uncharacterized membrane-anchored protein